MKIRIILAIVLIAGVTCGMFSRGTAYKPYIVLSGMPDHIPADSTVMIVTNRALKYNNPNEIEIANILDSAICLHYAIAIEKENRFDIYFVNDFSTLLNAMPQEALTVYVHGDGERLAKSLWRSSLMKQEYNTNVMVFSWPTKVPVLNGLKNFQTSIVTAKHSTRHLAMFLHEFEEYKNKAETQEIGYAAIIFHSLGNYLLERTIRDGMLDDMGTDVFDATLINAAATNSEGHDEWLSRMHMQKNTYVISNRHDINLRGAQLFTTLPLLLGQEPEGKLVEGVNYIDMSEAMGFTFDKSKSHTYFVSKEPMEKKIIRDFYSRLFIGGPKDLSDLGHRDKKNKMFVINAEKG